MQIRVRSELRVQVAPDCYLVPDVTLLDLPGCTARFDLDEIEKLLD